MKYLFILSFSLTSFATGVFKYDRNLQHLGVYTVFLKSEIEKIEVEHNLRCEYVNRENVKGLCFGAFGFGRCTKKLDCGDRKLIIKASYKNSGKDKLLKLRKIRLK